MGRRIPILPSVPHHHADDGFGEEVSLQNTAYSAEYEGDHSNHIASKAGTSAFHGSGFEFAQNDFFNPQIHWQPWIRRQPGKNRLRFNQFGGTIGDRLVATLWRGRSSAIKIVLFLFQLQGKKQNATVLGFARVLTEAERRGDFSSSLGACIKSGTTDVPLLNPNGTPSGQCIRVGQIFDPATTIRNPLFTGTASALNPEFIRQPFLNNQIPSGRLNPVAQAIINLQQPLPNQPGTDLNYLGTSGRC